MSECVDLNYDFFTSVTQNELLNLIANKNSAMSLFRSLKLANVKYCFQHLNE